MPTFSPVSEFSLFFPYQSYFDDTLLQTAIRAQPPNVPLVDGGLSLETRTRQEHGYGVALHPSSEAPVMIQFQGAGGGNQSTPVLCKPGQMVRPTGPQPGLPRESAFTGFVVGLPQGWLGGGLVRMLVLPSPNSAMAWETNNEMVFHRQRMRIIAPASMPAVASFPKNWPLRFPWRYSFAGTQGQAGTATLSVTPTRTLMRLRVTNLAAAATMRIFILGAREFEDEVTSTSPTTVSLVEHIWSTYSAAPVNYNNYPVEEAPFVLTRLGCDPNSFTLDVSGVQLVSSDAALQGQYVDIVRYGRL